MFGWLFLLMTVVPVVELYLLVRLGGEIGAGPTVAMVVAAGLLGAYLARSQGTAVLRNVRTAMAEGRVPGRELVEGALVLSGAVLLITPGVLTDLVAVFAMLPPTRRVLARFILDAATRRMKVVTVGSVPDFHPGRARVVDVTPIRKPNEDRSN